MNLGVQIAGLAALMIGISAGYLRWVRPRATRLNRQAAGLLGLLILTLMGGVIGSTAWWQDDPNSFSWDLPRLASRMLASAGLAFGAVTFATLEHPTVRRVRLSLLMLVVYLLPLAAIIVLAHLDRFDPGEPITYAFFIIVIGMILASLWYLLRPQTIEVDDARDSAPADTFTRGWLTGVAAVMAVWGAALFITDSGSDLIWVWPGDLLTSRLIAAMLLTIALAAFTSRHFRDTGRLTLRVLLVYGVGVIAANIAGALEGKPVKPVYIAVFGGMALVSAVVLGRQRAARP